MSGKPTSEADRQRGSAQPGLSVRKLLIGTLAATASTPLGSWDAAAHGNRSSHSAAAFRAWSADDYPAMRQELTVLNDVTTRRLRGMYDAFEALSTELGLENLRDNPGLLQMQEDIRQLENSVRVAPLSQQILSFAREGDVDAVTTALTAIGTPEDILDNSVWVLLDIAHLGDQGLLSTAEHSREFGVVAEVVLGFTIRRLEELRAQPGNPYLIAELVKAASVLHNIASFSLPDIGSPAEQTLEVGRRAMDEQLALRRDLGQPLDLVRALNLAGRLSAAAGDGDAAEAYFLEAETRATELNYRAGIAFNLAYRAEALQNLNPADAERMRDTARDLSAGLEDQVFEDIAYLQAILDQPR